MSRHVLAALAALAAAGALSACAPAGPPESAAYRLGWTQGCDSGYEDAGRQGYIILFGRDAARYETDGEYRKGWDQAHAECYDEEQRAPYMGGTSGAGV